MTLFAFILCFLLFFFTPSLCAPLINFFFTFLFISRLIHHLHRLLLFLSFFASFIDFFFPSNTFYDSILFGSLIFSFKIFLIFIIVWFCFIYLFIFNLILNFRLWIFFLQVFLLLFPLLFYLFRIRLNFKSYLTSPSFWKIHFIFSRLEIKYYFSKRYHLRFFFRNLFLPIFFSLFFLFLCLPIAFRWKLFEWNGVKCHKNRPAEERRWPEVKEKDRKKQQNDWKGIKNIDRSGHVIRF